MMNVVFLTYFIVALLSSFSTYLSEIVKDSGFMVYLIPLGPWSLFFFLLQQKFNLYETIKDKLIMFLFSNETVVQGFLFVTYIISILAIIAIYQNILTQDEISFKLVHSFVIIFGITYFCNEIYKNSTYIFPFTRFLPSRGHTLLN